MKSIKLPRRHFSYSQLSLWQRSKNEYRKRYFEGIKPFESKEMIFGREFAKEREIGICTGGKEFPQREVKIENTFQDIPLISYLDSADNNLNLIGEDKTGKKPWNQKRVENHEQLHFYSFQVLLKTGELPKKIFLNWFETCDFENKIKLTGKVKTFEFIPNKNRTDIIADKILQYTKEISDYYKKFQNEKIRNLNIQHLKKYAETKKQISELEEQLKDLSAQISKDLQKNNIEKYDSEFGKFTFQYRKTFKFSDEIKNLEKILKEKKEEEKGTAQFSEKKFLFFKQI